SGPYNYPPFGTATDTDHWSENKQGYTYEGWAGTDYSGTNTSPDPGDTTLSVPHRDGPLLIGEYMPHYHADVTYTFHYSGVTENYSLRTDTGGTLFTGGKGALGKKSLIV